MSNSNNFMVTPGIIGFPYHGLAVDEFVEIPNHPDGGVDVSAPEGDALLVRPPTSSHPRPPARTPDQAAVDAANGYEWRDYALLCGENRNLNGSFDISCGRNGWIYCDSGGNSWIVDAVFTTDTAAETATITIYLRKLIGRIDGNTYNPIDKIIGSITFRPTILDHNVWDPNETGSYPTEIYSIKMFPPMPTTDGKRSFICVHHDVPYDKQWDKDITRGAIWFRTNEVSSIMSEAFIVDISGVGSIDPATLGDGISASFTTDGTFTDFYQRDDIRTDDGNFLDCDNPPATSNVLTRTFTYNSTMLKYFDTNNNIKTIEYHYIREEHITRYTVVIDPSTVEGRYAITNSYIECTLTIGDHTYHVRADAQEESDVPLPACGYKPSPNYGSQELPPILITFISAGTIGYVRDHTDGSSYRRARVVSIWDGSYVDFDNGSEFESYLRSDTIATVHPLDGGIIVDVRGNTYLCYV